MKLRSALNPEEQTDLIQGPTQYRVGPNQSELICSVCGGSFYVDEVVFHQAMTAMEEGLENPFCCDECTEDYENVAH